MVSAVVAILATTLLAAFGARLDVAAAAIPKAGASYSGPSAHGDYTVELQPKCTANASTCASPSTVYLVLTPTAKEPARCQQTGIAANVFVFGVGGAGVPLHNGSFAVTDVFQGGIKIVLSGTFTSTGHVRGTISGLHVCGSDAYSITLPASVVTAAPCTLLSAVGAEKDLSFGKPAQPAGGELEGTTGGFCTQWFGPAEAPGSASLNFRVEHTLSALSGDGAYPAPDDLATRSPAGGLGPNGAVYYYPGHLFVVFARAGVWASLSYEVVAKGVCSATKPCALPAPGRAKVQAVLLGIARKLYPNVG